MELNGPVTAIPDTSGGEARPHPEVQRSRLRCEMRSSSRLCFDGSEFDRARTLCKRGEERGELA